jgi:hypothetical protein
MLGLSRQYVERQGCRIAECLDGVGEFFIGVAIGVTMCQNASVLAVRP